MRPDDTRRDAPCLGSGRDTPRVVSAVNCCAVRGERLRRSMRGERPRLAVRGERPRDVDGGGAGGGHHCGRRPCGTRHWRWPVRNSARLSAPLGAARRARHRSRRSPSPPAAAGAAGRATPPRAWWPARRAHRRQLKWCAASVAAAPPPLPVPPPLKSLPPSPPPPLPRECAGRCRPRPPPRGWRVADRPAAAPLWPDGPCRGGGCRHSHTCVAPRNRAFGRRRRGARPPPPPPGRLPRHPQVLHTYGYARHARPAAVAECTRHARVSRAAPLTVRFAFPAFWTAPAAQRPPRTWFPGHCGG